MTNIGDELKKAGLAVGPETKQCTKCGRPFQPGKPWHEECPACHRQRNAGASPSSEASECSFPDKYPDYFDDQGILRCEYVTTEAGKIAQCLGQKKMTMHQLRAFYQHVKLQEDALNNQRPFRQVRKELCNLQAFAHERAAKRKVPKYFEWFISANVKRVTANASDADAFKHAFLEGFVEHFQAVVAYCAGTIKEG